MASLKASGTRSRCAPTQPSWRRASHHWSSVPAARVTRNMRVKVLNVCRADAAIPRLLEFPQVYQEVGIWRKTRRI